MSLDAVLPHLALPLGKSNLNNVVVAMKQSSFKDHLRTAKFHSRPSPFLTFLEYFGSSHLFVSSVLQKLHILNATVRSIWLVPCCLSDQVTNKKPLLKMSSQFLFAWKHISVKFIQSFQTCCSCACKSCTRARTAFKRSSCAAWTTHSRKITVVFLSGFLPITLLTHKSHLSQAL